MLCIPKANHRAMVDECYPPPKSLASIGPEYKANSNELSKLTYYANRKPEKLTKVGKYLETKASTESKGVSGSGQAADKAKGSLMVTLAITKDLITECHRDINYFASSAAVILSAALQGAAKANAGKRDLDITARSAAAFFALSNYLNSASNSLDSESTRQYLNLISQFAKIAVEQGSDKEHQNRVRLIGLGALAGAIGSDAFFTPSYTQQLNQILPSLLTNIDAKTYASQDIQAEAGKIAESGVASRNDFAAQRKPVNSRSVPNFDLTTGEKAPAEEYVTSTAMGNIHAIIHNGDASHVQAFVAALVDFFNGKSGASRQWANTDWCCWVTQAISSWTSLQYRFIIPTNLVEYLVGDADGPTEEKHHTLVAIITSLLGGKLSMIGLSTSDTANNLLGFAVRRVHQDKKDSLLPPLVGAVGSLGTHVYYADQLNDLAEEITARIASIELPQIEGNQGGASVTYTDREEAKESIRMLLGCFVKLINTAKSSSGQVQSNGVSSGTRSQISPSVLHQTASLLASPDQWVRQSFEEALLAFLVSEVQKTTLNEDDPLSDKLGSKLSIEATGFTHSFSAALYVLTTSRGLVAPTSHKESPLEALPAIDRSNKEKQSSTENAKAAALPTDIAALVQILDNMVDRLPVATILGVVPALLAINKASPSLPEPRQDAANTLVKSSLNKIGKVCGISGLQNSVFLDKLPSFPPSKGSKTQTLEDAGFGGRGSGNAVRSDSVISSLSNSAKLQQATDLDVKALQNWFGRDWSVQIAVDDSYVGASPFKSAEDDPMPGQSSSRFASPAVDREAAAPAIVSNNESGVGVNDLRQALGNRSYGKSDYGGTTDSNGNGTLLQSESNGHLLPNGANLDKRTSRRASRKISQPIKSQAVNGVTNSTVGGLLDSMRVGLPEEEAQTNGQKPMAAPYVP